MLLFFRKQKSFVFLCFTAIFLFYLFTRLFLFSHEGPAAFGYDTGIYRHIIDGYFERAGDSTLQPFGFSHYSNALKYIGFSTDQILIGWYIALAFVLFFLLFFFVKTYANTPTALAALFLFSISTVQYEFFWWFYYRNFLAFAFFLAVLILLKQKSYFAILPLIAIGTVHVLTMVPIGLAMIFFCIFKKEERKYYLITGVSSLAGVLAFNWRELGGYVPYLEVSKGRVQNLDASMSEFSGQFIDFSFFWKHTILYTIFGVIGFIKYFKKQLFLGFLFAVSLLPIIFQTLFYRRFFIFADIFLIFFASVFLTDYLIKIKSRLLVLAVLFYVSVGVYLVAEYVLHKQPLLYQEDLQQIIALNQIPKAHVIAVSSQTAPWLYGFTHHAIIAPGIFEENKWNREQWEIFWTTRDLSMRHKLLRQYEIPLYVFIGPWERGFIGALQSDSHFAQKSEFLWQYIEE